MNRRIGISSGSLPAATAAELIDAGGDVVDLRVGKGHRWEADGIGPFERAGVGIAFVGIGLDLGRETAPDEIDQLGRVLRGRRLPVKVFAAAVLDAPGPQARTLAARQLDQLSRHASAVLAETHHGHAGPSALEWLCAQHGVGLVYDVLGWYRLTGGFGDPDEVVRAHAVAAQVKGFRPGDVSRHEPLAVLPESAWGLLEALPPEAAITVESRAGTLPADLALLRRRFARTEVGT